MIRHDTTGPLRWDLDKHGEPTGFFWVCTCSRVGNPKPTRKQAENGARDHVKSARGTWFARKKRLDYLIELNRKFLESDLDPGLRAWGEEKCKQYHAWLKEWEETECLFVWPPVERKR